MTKKVWYRSSIGTKIEDKGALTVANGAIDFTGKKGTVSGRIQSAKTRSVGFSNWIQVHYQADGEVKEAYFLISAMLGWGGILGANKQLTQALQAEAASAQQG